MELFGHSVCSQMLSKYLWIVFLPNTSVTASSQALDSDYHHGQYASLSTISVYLDTNIQYPEFCANNGIAGRVEISFVVDTDGKVSSPKIVHSLYPLFDTVALEAARKMPEWGPCVEAGRRVSTSFRLPLYFSYAGAPPIGKASNDYNECEHAFTTNRTTLYSRFPVYKGPYTDVSGENGVEGYFWILVYKNGTASRPKLLCKQNSWEPASAEDAFEKKMQFIDGGKAWYPAEINGEKVDCPMIISLTN